MKATDLIKLVEQEGQDFDKALKDFIANSEKKIADYIAAQYSNLVPDKLSIMDGPKYVRIVSIGGGVKGGGAPTEPQRSAWAFIDKSNGDILKAASWKAPAKTARGNIYQPETWKTVGPYGPAYLR